MKGEGGESRRRGWRGEMREKGDRDGKCTIRQKQTHVAKHS